MMHVRLILLAAALALVAAPLAFGLAGWMRVRRDVAGPPTSRGTNGRDWRLPLASALACTLAFNLMFFLQELFLVLPKAFVPGLHPTLYHNNHAWTGDNPLAALLQGTGVLATLLAGLACLLAARRGGVRSPVARLWLAWMAWCGCLMALPQVVAGALLPGSDVGMAMDYLRLGTAAKSAAALLALAGIVAVALALRRPLLEVADDEARIDGAAARTRFAFEVATLPALAATALIVPFRVPRDPIEVVVVPLAVMFAGVGWVQAGAWRVEDAKPADAPIGSLGWLAAAVAALLLVFQLVLRPGIAFG